MQDQEGYKREIAVIGKRNLEIRKWTRKDIGAGRILGYVQAALEAESLDGFKNNLVNWRFSKYLPDLFEGDGDLRGFEAIVYDFFKGSMPPGEAFDGLTGAVGRQYPLISYLFFLKDPDHHLPVAPSYFDDFFDLVDIEFRTRGRASWQNYQEYLAIIETVRHNFIDMGYHDTRLIDAHSFCWMVANPTQWNRTKGAFLKKKVQWRPEVPFEMLDTVSPGDLSISGVPPGIAPPDEDEFVEQYTGRMHIGRMAEEYALREERTRLEREGHPDLAERVGWTSQQDMSAGYDIRSFETDGRERRIEVKACRGNRDRFSFIVSDREFRKSRELENYYFYCVLFRDSLIDRMIGIPSMAIDTSFLKPRIYRAFVTTARK